jgi:type IV pilus assembly protein PilX
MLKRHFRPVRLVRAAGQRGMVLLVALVVLVALMVAGVAMIRSVDTATLVSGNIAFEQAATYAADKGIEQALKMLIDKQGAGALDTNDPSNGYYASLRSTDNPSGSQSWQAFWDATYNANNSVVLPTDQFANTVSFVVHRECANPKPPGSGGLCVASPRVTTSSGNAQEAGEVELQAASQIYYRITVRVSGPRRTESYVQSHVAL